MISSIYGWCYKYDRDMPIQLILYGISQPCSQDQIPSRAKYILSHYMMC